MDARRKFGNAGEKLAADFLEKRGYRILAQQWKNSVGEIDLVASKGGELIFIEVKTRATNQFGNPEDSVTATKLHKLQMLAQMYVQAAHWNGKFRIDVIAITSSPLEIRHIIAVS